MFYIKLAEHLFRINNLYSEVQTLCKDYEVELQSEEQQNIMIEILQTDIAYERKKSEAKHVKEGMPIPPYIDGYLETLAVYRKIAEQMIDYDTLLFHGSVIAVDGVGYLFTAKSGTGKSTHTKLWRQHFADRAVMVNDDKPLLHIAEDGIKVYGTPWDGKHRLSNNITVPLKAVCILNRDKTNHIEKVSGKDVYPLLLQQTYRSKDPVRMIHTLKLLDRLIQNTSIYSLGCNMEPEAAIVSYEGMQETKQGGNRK
ncbi:MAG: hypothetical protein PHS82_16165 [Lachnospiraceae bacterium]|nr:hypothetical protein [Lachnospiraceae bacterium]